MLTGKVECVKARSVERKNATQGNPNNYS